MKKIILLFLLFFNLTYFAQIDITVLYPLDIGNYWEYTDYNSVHYYKRVIGEKKMLNGKIYKELVNVDIIDMDTTYTYYRVEDNLKVFRYRENYGESKNFDFSLSEREIWKEDNYCGSCYRIVTSKQMRYYSLVEDSLLTLTKNHCYIDSSKVSPDTSEVIDIPGSSFAKGIGITFSGTIKLTGLIIKGVEYGEISSVKNDDKEQIINNYELKISSYPNPFNSSTNLVFDNPIKQKIKISIMNLLGQEVSKIADNYFSQGEQKVYLTMPINISAGTYFILLKTKNKQYTKKILYLK